MATLTRICDKRFIIAFSLSCVLLLFYLQLGSLSRKEELEVKHHQNCSPTQTISVSVNNISDLKVSDFIKLKFEGLIYKRKPKYTTNDLVNATRQVLLPEEPEFWNRYTQLHDHYTSLKNPCEGRFLVPSHIVYGLGNRVIQYVNALFHAFLTDRALLMNEDNLVEIAFNHPFKKWIYEPTDFENCTIGIHNLTDKSMYFTWIQYDPYKNYENIIEEWKKKDAVVEIVVEDAPVWRYLWKRPEVIEKLHSIGLKNDFNSSWQIYTFFLQSIYPDSNVLEELDIALEDLNITKDTHLVCATMRTGWDEKRNYIRPKDVPRYFEAARKLGNNNTRYFITSDNVQVMKNASIEFGDRFIQFFSSVDGRRDNMNTLEHTRHTVTEALLSAFCDEIIITIGSTFGQMSAALFRKAPLFFNSTSGHLQPIPLDDPPNTYGIMW